VGFLRTIFIIVLVYYAFRFIGRYIMPMVLKAAVNKVKKKHEQQMPDNQPQKPVGEVTIENIPQKPKNTTTSTEDEYVDFEDVKD
jgi:uncharacterized protein YbcC (UPF0753/DUF2309 family)